MNLFSKIIEKLSEGFLYKKGKKNGEALATPVVEEVHAEEVHKEAEEEPVVEEPQVEIEEPIQIEEQEVTTEEPTQEEESMDNDEKVLAEAKPTMKILIDNGHGNNTKGKRSPYSANKTLPKIDFYEYQWNREIANKIVERLKEDGYDAELLTPEETDISLCERTRRVSAWCDRLGKDNVLMISIHANAAGNGKVWYSARGWSAYTTKGTTVSDAVAEYLYDAAEKYLVGQRIRTDKTDGDRDYEENFYILKYTPCAAVLTENFFYDNVQDVKYILSEKGKENIVNLHVEGIENYINGKK